MAKAGAWTTCPIEVFWRSVKDEAVYLWAHEKWRELTLLDIRGVLLEARAACRATRTPFEARNSGSGAFAGTQFASGRPMAELLAQRGVAPGL
jgi:hypothetical protein